MFSLLIFLASLLLLAHAASLPPSTNQTIPKKWIVTLRPNSNITAISSHFTKVRAIRARNVATQHEDVGRIERQYRFGKFRGYAGSFDDGMVEELRGLSEVLHIEEDKIMHTSDIVTQDNTESWGLAAMSSRTKDATDYIYDSTAGKGMYTYVLDTGVRTTHQEFSGRAIWGYNAVNNITDDNVGHGTHVAGTIAALTHGVAKNSTIIAVKVFESSSGPMSLVLSGFTWAVSSILSQNRTSIAAINLSLSGPASTTWDLAISAAWASGVLVVVAAGNDNSDASLVSPARSPEVLCVGNLQRDDTRFGGTGGSNFGSGVGIWAPGTGIVSAWASSDDAIGVASGTSMAAPHVAGLVAYLRGLEGGMSAGRVKGRVLELGTRGRVKDGRGAADLVGFNGVGEV